MAYTANEFLVIIEGNLPDGEIWSNTWAVLDIEGGQNRQDAVDFFRDAYADFSAALSNDWSAVSASTKELSTGITTPRTWETVTGVGTSNNLPTECAIRISLNDQAGHRGGPFIAGFYIGVLEANGILTGAAKAFLAGGVGNLAANLSSNGFQLRIHRPTVESTVAALQAKVGEVFDVIRRRRNAISEDYLIETL